jgi:hypothetical protein
MGVKKFTFTEENYLLGKAFIEEIEGAYELTHDQMIRLHQISTTLGEFSQPGACPTCNRRARVFITAYVNEYERIIIRGEEA